MDNFFSLSLRRKKEGGNPYPSFLNRHLLKGLYLCFGSAKSTINSFEFQLITWRKKKG